MTYHHPNSPEPRPRHMRLSESLHDHDWPLFDRVVEAFEQAERVLFDASKDARSEEGQRLLTEAEEWCATFMDEMYGARDRFQEGE